MKCFKTTGWSLTNQFDEAVHLQKRMIMRFLISVLMMILTSCHSSAQKGKEVKPDEFEKALADKNIQLLDVRTAGEFRNGYIKGALQANWNNETEFKERTLALDKNKPVYVYCLSGPRSSAAAEWLREKGFENVVELNGGFINWKRNNKPVEGLADVKQMTLAEYHTQMEGKEYVLVDFGAAWCPPCRKMEPVIDQFISANRQIYLFKVDGGVHTDLMKQLKVEGIPTFVLLKNGNEVWRHNGIISSDDIEKIWLQYK
jgi:rhodanese-related sulfurtransferase